MWVSGSLIRSSTWRSSSVSAPCISRSICLPSSVREIAHDARQLLPGIADRLHARLHHAFLQLGGDVGQPLQRRLEFGILVPAHDLEQLVAREHQLRDHGHQLLERVDGDADRLVADFAARRPCAFGRRRPWRGCAGGARPASRGRRARGRRANPRPARKRPFQHLRRQRADASASLRQRPALMRSTMRSRSAIRSSSAPSGSRCSRSSDFENAA